MSKISRSPRAPSFDLEDCLNKALLLYKDNGRHAVPADVAAKKIGYSGAKNGSAARSFASMKAFGLAATDSHGDLTISSEVESYKFTPDHAHKQELLLKWLSAPRVFSELLSEYADRLPSDEVVRYRLIKMGFLPGGAEDVVKVFKSSVSFADFYGAKTKFTTGSSDPAQDEEEDSEDEEIFGFPTPRLGNTPPPADPPKPETPPPANSSPAPGFDRIPVRLTKGRRAWIEIPTSFYEADKVQLRNQIDLILADEEDEG